MPTDNEKLTAAAAWMQTEYPRAYEALLTPAMRQAQRQIALRCGQDTAFAESMQCFIENAYRPGSYEIDEGKRRELNDAMKQLFHGDDVAALMAIQLSEIQMESFMLAEAMLRLTASETLASWAGEKGDASEKYQNHLAKLQHHFMCAGISEGIGTKTAKMKIGKFQDIIDAAIIDGLGLERSLRQQG